MKIIVVNIGDTIIEFDNDMWTGHENIYVNGALVSRKFSWFGTDHIFEVKEDGVCPLGYLRVNALLCACARLDTQCAHDMYMQSGMTPSLSSTP